MTTNDTIKSIIDDIELLFEIAGVLALVVGALVTGAKYFVHLLHRPPQRALAYGELRRGLGRAILVGLELLVAADIIRTVAIEPTLQSVGVLGLIVLVRTFLSWSLEVEINGRWPWQRANARDAAASASTSFDDAV